MNYLIATEKVRALRAEICLVTMSADILKELDQYVNEWLCGDYYVLQHLVRQFKLKRITNWNQLHKLIFLADMLERDVYTQINCYKYKLKMLDWKTSPLIYSILVDIANQPDHSNCSLQWYASVIAKKVITREATIEYITSSELLISMVVHDGIALRKMIRQNWIIIY